MENFERFKALINRKIRFRTYEGEYEGIVTNLCQATKRLTVARVVFLPDKIYMGNLHFLFGDIESYSVVTLHIPKIHQAASDFNSSHDCANDENRVNFSRKKDQENKLIRTRFDDIRKKPELKLPENECKLKPSSFTQSQVLKSSNIYKHDKHHYTKDFQDEKIDKFKCSKVEHGFNSLHSSTNDERCLTSFPKKNQENTYEKIRSPCYRAITKQTELNVLKNQCKQQPQSCTGSQDLNSSDTCRYDERVCTKDFQNEESSVERMCNKFAYVDMVEKMSALSLPENFHNELPLEYAVIDKLNGDFDKAVEQILKENLVGVSFEGSEINRENIPSLISISTSLCVFIFDVLKLKKKAFDNGLRKVFQDENIEKVIHDCREASDCLLNQFATQLVNVFDTQLADITCRMYRSGNKKISKHVNSLHICLLQYLELSSEYLHRPKQLQTGRFLFFNQRPMSKEFLNFSVQNAIYLRLLKQKMFLLLMNPFYRAVDVYLNALASATNDEILEQSVEPKVKNDLLREGIKTVSFHDLDDSLSDSSEHIENESHYLKNERRVHYLERAEHFKAS